MKKSMIVNMLFLAAFWALSFSNALGAGNQYYVDNKNPNASDENPGTKDKPWKTVVFAGKTLKAGDKLLIMPGVYYGRVKLENSGEEGKPIIIEGSALGEVMISGEKKLKGWTRCEKHSKIWEAPYTQELYFWPPGDFSKISRFYVSSEPADLTMNGMPLFWSHDDKFLTGTWKVDKEAKKIYVRLPDDADPNTRLMQVIGDDYGVDIPPRHGKSGDYVIIRNLVIRRFGRGLRLYGKHIRVENNIIEWCAYDGAQLGSGSTDLILKNNVIRWNGTLGTNMPPKGRIINNKILFNNWKLNSPGWHSAGLKAAAMLGGVIEGNESAYNGALGLWLDYANNIELKNNITHDNANMGLENESGHKASWTGNVSYRNKIGFINYSSSNILVKGNIISDNHLGIQYHFRRSRVPSFSPKWIKKKLNAFRKTHSKEIAYDWMLDYVTYGFPCSQFRNNLTENNLLLNNGMNFDNAPPRQLTDTKEKWLVSDNVFKDNIFVNSKPEMMISSFSSLAQYQKKTKDAKGCLSFSKLDPSKLPDWARELYAKHSDRLNYPRSYQSVKSIYRDLNVKNGWCGYTNFPAPSGLLALARICESEQLKEKKFSDPFLKAYFISYKGKPTLVLWRKHGHPSDFVPVLLKRIPKEATLQNSWDQAIPIKRKNDIASINVGTWPLYIVGVDENISEIPAFSLKFPEKLEFGKTMEVVIENPVGAGELYIDKYQGVKDCPEKVIIEGDKIAFPLTLTEDARDNFVRFRIAGQLDGLYSGQMIRLFTGKSGDQTGRILQEKGFTPLTIDSVANCRLDGDPAKESLMQMGASRALLNLPEKIKLGEIPFVIGKGPKACIGFNSVRVKGKVRPDIVTIDLGGKKYKSVAFLQACSWAPKKMGVPLLKCSLNYDDNLAESTYIKNGLNVLDWWKSMDESNKKILNGNSSWLVWTGNCGSGHDVSVYAYVWVNPKPNVGVNTLQISVADPDKKALMGVLAVSVLENKKK